MRITTLAKNYFFYCVLILTLFGQNGFVYSQCPTVANTTQSFCDTQSPTIASLQAIDNGGGIKWYATATSNTQLTNSTVLVNGEDYFADDNTGNCGPRQSVTVTIYSAPTGANFQGVCVTSLSQANPSNPQFVIFGNNLQWYTTPSGGTALSPTAILTDNTIYYISQTNPDTGCETSRLSVFVNVGLVPAPTGNAVQEFCNIPGSPPTVADLVASGNNNWYLTSAFGIPLNLSTPLINGQFYYATTVDPPCESNTRLEVLVNLYEPNDAGNNGNRSICVNEIATTNPFDLFNLLGGTPDNTGVWTGPIATTNGSQGTLNVATMTLAGSPYVFTYTVSSALCAPDTSTVTITILALPTASVAVNPNPSCSGSSATFTFTGTPNATVTYNINGGSNQTIILNGAGTATLTGNYTADTTVNIISVASSGNPSCVNPQTSSITLTVLPLPLVSVAVSPSPICSGGSATFTFTGTPNATVTYNINGSANQTIVLNGTGTATLTGTYSVNTTVNIVSVASSGTPSCVNSQTSSITLTVLPLPVVSVSVNPTAICAGDSATFTFTGTPNATVTYNINGGANQTIVLNGAGTATLTGTYTADTTVNIVSVVSAGTPSCVNPQTSSITLTIQPLPIVSVAVSPTTICANSSATFTFTGTPNATVTYNINGGANQTIVLNGAGTATLTGTYTADTTINIVSVASAGTPSCVNPQTSSVTLTVQPLPTVSIAVSPTTLCSGDSATFTFTGTPNATVTYNINGGANQTILLNGTGTATLTGTYTADTTVNIVSVASAGIPSCVNPQTSSVTLTIQPLPTVSVSVSPTTLCSGDSATFTFTGTPNATVTYNINGGANQTIVLNGTGTATLTGTYTADTTINIVSVASAGTPSCVNPQTSSVTLTVQPLPTVSIAVSPTTLCSGDSATFTFTGTPNATVTYNINGGANQTIVLNGTGTATLTGTYTADTTINIVSVASAGTPSCVNPQTSSVTLTIQPLPTVSVSVSPTTMCSGDSATFTFTGTPNATVTYNINGDANQTIVLNGTGTATLAGTYTADTTINIVSVASAGTPSCVNPQTSSVTLTVQPLPTVSIAVSPTTICANSSATFTFTGTPNATVTYNINGGANQTIVLNGAGTATLTGTYTADTTINIVSVASAGTPSCVNPQTSSVTLTIQPLPTVSVSVSPTTMCSGDSATFTFTGAPNATVTYNINGGANQTILLNGTGTATLTGTYTADTTVNIVSVASAGIPSCVNPQTSSVTLTVQPLPTVSIAVSPTTLCSGDSATFTFTGTPNATVTYNVNGGANQTIVLNGAGTATLTGTYTADTTINIVSVVSSGTPSCVNPQTSSITLTVQPLPTVSVAVSPTTICSGDSATFTFSGTPNATVTYNINGGANQTIVLNGTGTATLTGTYTADTTINIVSVASAGTPSCVNPQASSVTLTIQPLPTVSVSVSPTTLCSGDSATFTFTGTPNATVTYNINGGANQTIVLNGTGTATLTGTYTADTTINIVSVASAGTPSCVNPQTSSVTLTIQPLPTVSVSVSPTTLCSGDSATFTFTGTPNATVTYNVNGGANQTIVLNGAGTATLTGTYTADTTINIVSVVSSGTPSCVNPQTSSITLTVQPLPTVSVAVSPTTICSGDSATFTFSGTPNATVTYNINGGANQTIVLNGTGTAILTGTYTANTTVNIISVASSSTPSCVNPQASSTTLTVVEPPIAGTNASITICILNPSFDLFPLLGSTAQTGGTWSPALASGTGVFNPAVDVAGTYTYTILGTTPCPSSSASVEVIVNPIPDAGNDGTLAICSNQNSVDLFASLSGTPQLGGTWSPALVSGTGIFNPAVDTSGVYTYTITGVAPCVDDTSTVTVTVTPGPEAGNNNSVTLCVNSPTQDLALLLGPNSQPGGVWSPAMVSGTGVFNPAVDPQGDYTYTLTGTQPCDNDFAVITVAVNPVPDAGNDNSLTLCSNDSAQDLFLLLGANAQAGGTWSPALASGTGYFNPAIDVAGTYTYSVGGGLCTTDTADVVVTIIQASNSGGVGQTLNVCVTSTSVDLFTGLDGTQGIGTWNDDDATGALLGNIFNPSSVGVGTYHFTYTVIGTSPCANSSSTVTVIVNPQPNAGTFTGIVSLCPSVGVLDLATLLTGQNPGGVWTDGSAVVVTSPITIISFAPGTYSYTYSVTNACTTDTEVVQFTILANPIITTVNITISPACLGSNVIVNLNGMVDGTYTLSYDLSGANTLPGQTATVTIASGIGNFSIPTASLPNVGTTVITFTNILNTVTNCSSTLTNVAAQIQVRPLADIDSPNLSAANVCFGDSVVVNIANAVNLPDGVYQFNYSIPGATPTTGVTGNVTVTGGIGQFTIPASIFTVAGNYTLTIIGIIATTGCTNANETATVSFVINPIPSITTATVTVQDTCANYASLVTISGATDLPNGDYTIIYQLSGANAASTTVTVAFTGGTGSFTIPATDLINNGVTTLTISQLNSVATNCGVGGNVVDPIDFNVTELGTPEIIQNGNLFCQDDNPTIETLAANLVGFPTVIWYNAPTGGTAYASTDLLVNGTTYYAALVAASGCEGAVRLEVTVDTTVCDDLFIPDGYSPNNDGINDTFEIPNLALLYPNFKLEIYNRYGNLIYTGNRNTPNWDGTTTVSGLNLGNNLLPVGVYFYILNFNDGAREAIQGRVYLNR